MPTLVAAGLLGGAVGLLTGGALGAILAPERSDDYDLRDAVFVAVGAVIGETLALPLAVHWANGGRGSLPLALAASTGIAAAGLLSTLTVESTASNAILVAIPIAQITGVVAIERATSR